MNMLKRYTHLRAWQLVSKLDARRRQTQKSGSMVCAVSLPISRPSMKKMGRKRIVLRSVILITFTSLPQRKRKQFTAPVRFLLRTLAIAAQKGERVPSPGALPVNDPDYIMICPLNPGSTPL